MPDEEPAAAADGGNADRVFDQVVVDLKGTRLQVSGERLVFVEEVTERLAQAALGQELGLESLSPFLDGGPDRGSLFLTDLVAVLRQEVLRLTFDAVKLPELANEPDRTPVSVLKRPVELAARVRLIKITA